MCIGAKPSRCFFGCGLKCADWGRCGRFQEYGDYEFSGNGILFADRTPKPALQEVKYYYGKYQ